MTLHSAHSPAPASEFSRVIDTRHIDDKPVALVATPDECKALARRFDLVAVNTMEATVTLIRDGAAFVARGRIRADIVQSCAISGEDLPAIIDDALHMRFIPPAGDPTGAVEEEIEISEDECDEIEFTGERFDLGEAVAQSLGLGIDPFAEGPEADRVRKEILADDGLSGPFAALAALKKP